MGDSSLKMWIQRIVVFFFFRGGGGGRGGVVYALKDVQNLIPRKYFSSFNVQNINYAMSPDMFTIDLSAFASYHNLSVKIGKILSKNR